MTVAELITQLADCPQDAKVVIGDDYSDHVTEVSQMFLRTILDDGASDGDDAVAVQLDVGRISWRAGEML